VLHRAQALGRRPVVCSRSPGDGRIYGQPKRHESAAETDHIAVGESAPRADARAVEIRAILRESIVGDGPLTRDAVERRMRTRYLFVPRQADVVRWSAAEREAAVIRGKEHQDKRTRVVA